MTEHVCADGCAHTVDVGYVHTIADDGGCRDACSHPEHQKTWWHRYRGELADDNGSITVTIGPCDIGPTSRGRNGKLASEVAFAHDVLGQPLELTYVGTYDVEPPEDER